jgi:hypothetical protein
MVRMGAPVRSNATAPRCAVLGLVAATAFAPSVASAFVVAISPGTRAIYLQVGNGTFTGIYSSGGTPGNNSTVNRVSVTVPANAVGTGTAQQMTGDSTAANSFYDNYVFCVAPPEIYVGGFFRQPGATGTATLSVTSPTNLVNAAGDRIPFTQINWTSRGNGDTGTQPFPAGTFTGATQALGTFASNTWQESCHTFSYRNTAIVPAGVYTGRVTYTLSAP